MIDQQERNKAWTMMITLRSAIDTSKCEMQSSGVIPSKVVRNGWKQRHVAIIMWHVWSVQTWYILPIMLDCAPSVLRPFGYKHCWPVPESYCLMSRSKLDSSIIFLISRSSSVLYLWLLCFHRLPSNAYLCPSNVTMAHFFFCNILVRHCHYLVGSTSQLIIS